MRPHPAALVAKIKGAALAGIPYKVITRHTGVTERAIRNYVRGQSRADVEPDFSVIQKLRDLLAT